MTQNETKFMGSAMALAETLHFTKAARDSVSVSPSFLNVVLHDDASIHNATSATLFGGPQKAS